jgi:hypothetical protein
MLRFHLTSVRTDSIKKTTDAGEDMGGWGKEHSYTVDGTIN